MTEYEKGYNQALKDINCPMIVVVQEWSSSKCPRCKHDFCDYEICEDGYYHRAKSLLRCPYCGQRLDWNGID